MPQASSSSAVRRYFYVPDDRELHVVFRDSGEYVYFDVPLEEYRSLSEAASKGTFINQRIKGQYRCERRGGASRRIWLAEDRWPFRRKSG